ncbi:shikimate kinase [Paenibacillus nasutitermitis]|uniref:Shikimate kinase n=1 Tax=Paenibacillus nasutitermitis TaxID=1652958 RepID=A0A917DTF0_9BACL|nr:shikimate kinase [Paenibacillus nasutitermitis]GGD65377.1 shikimate kinase [Paenibacillus nasutitermitis]
MADNQKNHIVLVGFMGTGKSTVSQQLAKRLDCESVDVDCEIESREGQSIAEIFAGRGEEAFRQTETAVLVDVLGSRERKVVATGGGAVLDPRNCDMMLNHALVVALTADAHQIISRVSHDSSRPLLQGDLKLRVNRLLEDRKHAYDFADLTIDTTRLNVHEVVDAIIACLKQ